MRSQNFHDLAAKDKIAFKKHALLRMYERGIFVDEVKQALVRGEIIESYPQDRPLPSCLVLGYTDKNRAIHALAAADVEEEMVWIITVYKPTLEEWQEGFRRRRAL